MYTVRDLEFQFECFILHLNDAIWLYLLWLVDLRWILEKNYWRSIFKRTFEQVNLPVIDIRILTVVRVQLRKIDHIKFKSTYINRLLAVNSARCVHPHRHFKK